MIVYDASDTMLCNVALHAVSTANWNKARGVSCIAAAPAPLSCMHAGGAHSMYTF